MRLSPPFDPPRCAFPRSVAGGLQGPHRALDPRRQCAALPHRDMTVCCRPASSTPERSVERLAAAAHVPIPGDETARRNRVSAIGGLTGIATGVAVGAGYGLLRAAGLRLPTWGGALLAGAIAMAAANVPMTATGITDPAEWSGADWLADALPHAAYGAVTAATYAATER